MAGTRKSVALFGQFGSDNLGNEASLEALLDVLRRERPELRLTCLCYGTSAAQRQHQIEALPLKLPYPAATWFRVLDRLTCKVAYAFLDLLRACYLVRRFDALMVPGTGILDDFSERWQAMPYDLFKWGLAARLNRRPFAFISVGAGPIKRPLSRWLMVRAARMARYRSYRDEASKSYMVNLGAGNSADRVYPDIAFELPTPKLEAEPPRDDHGTIGVGVMNYYGWDRSGDHRNHIRATYEAHILQFVFWLIEKGYRVRLLMGAQSDMSILDDIVRQVTERLGPRAADAIINDPAPTLHDLMKQIQMTDLIVATRFHNIVAALKVGRSAISIGYAAKNENLLIQAGLPLYVQHAEQIDTTRLIAQFSKLVIDREHHEKVISQVVNHYRDLLKEQNEFLLRHFF